MTYPRGDDRLIEVRETCPRGRQGMRRDADRVRMHEHSTEILIIRGTGVALDRTKQHSVRLPGADTTKMNAPGKTSRPLSPFQNVEDMDTRITLESFSPQRNTLLNHRDTDDATMEEHVLPESQMEGEGDAQDIDDALQLPESQSSLPDVSLLTPTTKKRLTRKASVRTPAPRAESTAAKLRSKAKGKEPELSPSYADGVEEDVYAELGLEKAPAGNEVLTDFRKRARENEARLVTVITALKAEVALESEWARTRHGEALQLVRD
ncbi:hypothetical protein B0H34DRAFT_181413 [Crassisporium funariophilum]|nr:hypothetical protein B0H34DRAFT_181413 [Crassisporium funariophilum]